jgi:hypothetical protein
MAELIPDMSSIPYVSPAQRRDAALNVAEFHPHDKPELAYVLLLLGLAEHRADGTFAAAVDSDGHRWFSRREDAGTRPLTMTLRQLYDRR